MERARGLLPGLALCVAISLAAYGVAFAQVRLAGRAHLDALVAAILIGAAIRAAGPLGRRLTPGVAFAGKWVLEAGVVLLGAGFTFEIVRAATGWLLVAIAAIVALSAFGGYWIGRACGLPGRVAILIASGNAICGNSAIVAVAPVVRAGPDDVARAIAFTAWWGVLLVFALPMAAAAAGLAAQPFGTLAGLTIYSVPQVVAATLPSSVAAAQVGGYVKLIRILMLAPLIAVLALMERGRSGAAAGAPTFFLPWFVTGFFLVAALATAGYVPPPAADVAGRVSHAAMLASMAALGLGVDLRQIARAPGPILAASFLSLALLILMSAAYVAIAVQPPAW